MPQPARTMSKAPESKKQTRRSLTQIGFLHLSKISSIMWLFRLVSQMAGTPGVFAREPPGRVELPGFLFGLFACGPSSPLKTTAPPAIKNSKDFIRDTLFPLPPRCATVGLSLHKARTTRVSFDLSTSKNIKQAETTSRSSQCIDPNTKQVTMTCK